MEFDLIERIRLHCSDTRSDVRLGIGDDAAILVPPPGAELLASTDTLVEGVHFLPGTPARELGWKALAVNLSDLAAMGATPAWALLALTLPRADAAFVDAFAAGFAELARRHGVALVGGDTTSGPLAIGVTVLGFAPAGAALRRDGARPGDRVFVTGTLGDGVAGLHCLRGGAAAPAEDAPADARAAVVARLQRPEPRVVAGLALRGLASACIDTSDGLLGDLGHIAERSAVAIEVEAEALPASAALRALYPPAQRLALQAAGGDDYQLAFTAPAQRASAIRDALGEIGCPLSEIGRVTAGSGVRLLAADGREIHLAERSWQHFG